MEVHAEYVPLLASVKDHLLVRYKELASGVLGFRSNAEGVDIIPNPFSQGTASRLKMD